MKTTSISVVLAMLPAAFVSALPTLEQRWSSPSFWSSQAGQAGSIGRRDWDWGVCDLSKACLPQAPIPLPGPSANLTLSHVTVGRGTQNYTCDLSNSTAIPVAVGATASLYNVSCVAAVHPSLLAFIPAIALNLPVPCSSDSSSPVNMDLSGHHYFLDPTTPFFNLDTANHQYGVGAFKKVNSTAAPTGAAAGQGGSGYGAVPWLKLNEKDQSSGQVLKEVFRVNTAGGQPPKTCQGQSALIEIQYAAEYWVYV